MTLKERTDKAMANGMHLIGKGHMKADGQQFWLVSSEGNPDKGYIVSQQHGHLDCNCPATKPCKHICFVSRLLNAERTEAAQQPWENQANAEAAYAARLAYNKVMYAAERAEEEAKRRETALLDTGLRFDPQTGLALTEREVA